VAATRNINKLFNSASPGQNGFKTWQAQGKAIMPPPLKKAQKQDSRAAVARIRGLSSVRGGVWVWGLGSIVHVNAFQ